MADGLSAATDFQRAANEYADVLERIVAKRNERARNDSGVGVTEAPGYLWSSDGSFLVSAHESFRKDYLRTADHVQLRGFSPYEIQALNAAYSEDPSYADARGIDAHVTILRKAASAVFEPSPLSAMRDGTPFPLWDWAVRATSPLWLAVNAVRVTILLVRACLSNVVGYFALLAGACCLVGLKV